MAKTSKDQALAVALPALNVQLASVADLVPYAGNARLHSPEQIDRISESIKNFGFTVPVLVAEDGTIIAGHGRVMAAKKLGLDEIPIIVAKGWTEEQQRAYGIADNRLAETSEWDMAALQAELAAISSAGEYDLNSLGFSPEDIEQIAAGAFAPELLPETSVSQVTDADVEKAQEKLDDLGASKSEQKLLSVMCPHCATEFDVDPNTFNG